MNNVTTNEPVEQVDQHFYVDAEGNRVEVPFDLDAAGDGETSPAETAFIAEDGADHPVTVH